MGTEGQGCAMPISDGYTYEDTVAVTLDIDAKVNVGTEEQQIPFNLSGDYRAIWLPDGNETKWYYGIEKGEWNMVLKYDIHTNRWILFSRSYFDWRGDYCHGFAKDECMQMSDR